MAPNQPQLGSLAVQGPSLKPQTIHVSPTTCQDLSLFKDILKEYRRLDDTIVMRLNRANASMRDKDRIQGLSGGSTLQDQACEYIWRELVANWKRRTQLVEYCVSVVDQSITEKRTSLEDQSQDPASQRKTQGQIYADEVKRKQVHRELTVEEIVRKRSADAFRSRCQYFVPPQTDAEARKMWEAAQKE
ncbi:caffeine-induced death protein 2-domain-containing protein [Flammula alnicola]|nr:caffeine-induced death protein 2-domain-containing protein [Flammula alnicola]